MFFKCEMLVGGYTYDVTDDLVNWDDVELAYKRDNYDGVIRSFSTKFEFANKAYSLLVSQWGGNYLASSASIVYYKRNNSWLWSEVFRCSLDFSTFSYNGTTCSINAVDSSLAALIKAKKGTQYEWVVSGMKEEEPLRYDRLLMRNNVEWTLTGTEEENEGGNYTTNSYECDSRGAYFPLPLYVANSEIAVRNSVEVNDVENGKFYTLSDAAIPFIKNTFSKEIRFTIGINFPLIFLSVLSGEYNRQTLRLCLVKSSPVQGEDGGMTYTNEIIHQILMNEGANEIEYTTSLFSLSPGESLSLVYHFSSTGSYEIYSFSDTSNRVTIDFMERDKPVDIDVVKPSTLLNRLLKSMNGGQSGITGIITSGVDERLDSTYILAAESVRGLEGAKLYSSYTKFCEWMSAEFGFVPVIDDANKTVTFAHRDSLFVASREKDLGDSCTDFEYEVDSSMIYSRVRVGYDKQDYDSMNGRDEFRFTNEYTTGVTLTDNSLELISPYRADAYGIEFLAAKRGEETTDDDSDTDVFFVGATLAANTGGDASEHEYLYALIRGGDYAVTGVISPETMFNAMYSQRFMISANAKYIGSSCSGLEYASSDGNSDVSIGGISEKSDISLPNRLFTVGKLSVTIGDMEIPDSMGGSFDLVHNGTTYRGYLQDVSFNIGKGEDVKYTLIVWAIGEP